MCQVALETIMRVIGIKVTCGQPIWFFFLQAAYLEHKRRKRKKKGLDVISIEALAAEHLSRDGKVDVFAQAVSALLNAYTRRMCQVTDLIEGFGEEIEQVETSRSLDRISFLLR